VNFYRGFDAANGEDSATQDESWLKLGGRLQKSWSGSRNGGSVDLARIFRSASMTERAPSVSVCVPTYNCGRFLPDCIESVLDQSLEEFELVITDDDSNDETENLVTEYLRLDSRIRYFKNERRLGMNGNLRRAAGYARAPLVKMLCADDWLAPNCLEHLKDLLNRHPTAVLATSACVVTDERGQPLEVNFIFGEEEALVSGEKMLSRMATRGGSFGGHSSFMFRRSSYDEVGGYDDQLLYAADLELGARLCRVGDYVHTDAALFYGRQQSGSSSAVNPGRLWDLKDYLEIPRKLFVPRAALDKEWWRWQAFSGMTTAKYLVNAGVALARGDKQKSRAILDLLWARGNLWIGIPWAIPHLFARGVRRVVGLHRPRSRAPQPGMGLPIRRSLLGREKSV
jgi:glycosyltransferase involved in cell wall biosynthesis